MHLYLFFSIVICSISWSLLSISRRSRALEIYQPVSQNSQNSGDFWCLEVVHAQSVSWSTTEQGGQGGSSQLVLLLCLQNCLMAGSREKDLEGSCPQGYPGEEQFQFPHPTSNHVLCSNWMLLRVLTCASGWPPSLSTSNLCPSHEVTGRAPDKGLGLSTQRLWVSCCPSWPSGRDSSTVSVRTKWTQSKTFANYNSLTKVIHDVLHFDTSVEAITGFLCLKHVCDLRPYIKTFHYISGKRQACISSHDQWHLSHPTPPCITLVSQVHGTIDYNPQLLPGVT